MNELGVEKPTMRRLGKLFAIMAVALSAMLISVDMAEARRAGGGFSGFGSRGTRTFSAPPVTRTAPNAAAPIERSMTPRANTNTNQPAAAPNAAPGRGGMFGGMFGGFAGSMLGGLAFGGLIGMMLGHGIGGGAGFLGLLLQGALIFGAITLAMRFFNRGRQPAMSGAGAPGAGFGNAMRSSEQPASPGFAIPRIGSGAGNASAAPYAVQSEDINVGQADLEHFEQMLKDLQKAYGAEDYAALRQLTTPEAMSYLAEELSENATKGLKNEVRDVHLVQGDVSEAWREDGTDYATVAMRYESIDVVRDRATGRVVSGDPDNLSEAVELWTFMRRRGGDWLVSAIQGTGDPA